VFSHPLSVISLRVVFLQGSDVVSFVSAAFPVRSSTSHVAPCCDAHRIPHSVFSSSV
jgi:hypothetical protein